MINLHLPIVMLSSKKTDINLWHKNNFINHAMIILKMCTAAQNNQYYNNINYTVICLPWSMTACCQWEQSFPAVLSDAHSSSQSRTAQFPAAPHHIPAVTTTPGK